MIDQSKRRLMIATGIIAATSSFAGFVGEAGAQAKPYPKPAETRYFLSSRYRLRLLLGRLYTLRAISLDIIAEAENLRGNRREQLQALMKRKFSEETEARLDMKYTYGPVLQLRSDRRRVAFIATLPDDADRRMLSASKRLDGLVNNLGEHAAKRELDPRNPAVGEVINSLHHAERIAVLEQNHTKDEAWYCRRFPFSWFCRQ